MHYKEILKLTTIEKIRVKDNLLIINDDLTFSYTHNKIAKAVASKLKNFIGVK